MESGHCHDWDCCTATSPWHSDTKHWEPTKTISNLNNLSRTFKANRSSKPTNSTQIPKPFEFSHCFFAPPKRTKTRLTSPLVPMARSGLQWPLGPLWALKTGQSNCADSRIPRSSWDTHFLFLNYLFGLWKKSQDIQKLTSGSPLPRKRKIPPMQHFLSSFFPCRLCGCIIARSNAPQMCFGWGFKATNNKHPKNCAKPSNSVEVSGWIMLNYYLKKTAIPLWEEKCTTFFLVSHVRSFEFHSNTLIKYIYIYLSKYHNYKS